MKKAFLIAMFLVVATTSFAQNRGVLQNTWASWASITSNTTRSFNLPYNARDVLIHNGSSSAVCVSLKGYALNNTCDPVSGNFGIMEIAATSQVQLFDYPASNITIRNVTGVTASPITVIVTY